MYTKFSPKEKIYKVDDRKCGAYLYIVLSQMNYYVNATYTTKGVT